MRGIVLAAVVMLGGVASAQAADMPDFLRGSLGGSTGIVNWQGFYVGGQAGYGTANMTFSGSTASIVNSLLANTDLNPNGAISTLPLGGKVSVHGDGFGGFAGYNSQWTDVVLGVELSYLHASFNAAASGTRALFFTDSQGFFDTVKNQSSSSIAISDMGTFRVRGGYAVGSFLPYLFGGIALGQANIVNSVQITANQMLGGQNIPFNPSATDGRFGHLIYGYSAGLGVDVNLIGGLFMRAEWEYVRFTDQIDTGINTVRAGLGYKF
jgi:outer membrane immunogenic protein